MVGNFGVTSLKCIKVVFLKHPLRSLKNLMKLAYSYFFMLKFVKFDLFG
jgi:hypothetical protein